MWLLVRQTSSSWWKAKITNLVKMQALVYSKVNNSDGIICCNVSAVAVFNFRNLHFIESIVFEPSKHQLFFIIFLDMADE